MRASVSNTEISDYHSQINLLTYSASDAAKEKYPKYAEFQIDYDQETPGAGSESRYKALLYNKDKGPGLLAETEFQETIEIALQMLEQRILLAP